MSFSASDVKNLRDLTGAGMMDCKKALTENNGDVDKAVDFLRTKGLAAAQKKQSRIAAEGTVVTMVEGNIGVVVEINCETDFVSKNEDFQKFANTIANDILKTKPSDVAALKASKEEEINEITLKIGEKIDIRRFDLITSNGALGSYNHGGRIGVIVNVDGADASNEKVSDLLKDLAMHTAAASPKFVSSDDIDQDYKNKEAEIYAAQLKEEGKPENMIEKIVVGKLKKLSSEVCLLEQKFVKDPDMTVGKLVESVAKEVGADLKVTSFFKMNLGEGIEKKEDNLADEVAKISGGN
jgi:elongation factor Ts